MGEEAERRLRLEMDHWDDDRLIAKSIKSPGFAEDIAARQILEKRRVKREARRFHITSAFGLIGLALSAAAAWFAWKAIPEVPANSTGSWQLPESVPSGDHMSLSSPTPQSQPAPLNRAWPSSATCAV
jgi:hypothetical protein